MVVALVAVITLSTAVWVNSNLIHTSPTTSTFDNSAEQQSNSTPVEDKLPPLPDAKAIENQSQIILSDEMQFDAGLASNNVPESDEIEVEPEAGVVSESEVKPKFEVVQNPLLSTPSSLETVKQVYGHLSDERLNDGREFVEIDTQSILTLDIGETFQITLPSNEENFTGAVNNIINYQGVKRLSGYFEGLKRDSLNRFSITVTEEGDYVVGNFSIRSNSFVMEAIGQVGWINPSENEENFLLKSEREQLFQ